MINNNTTNNNNNSHRINNGTQACAACKYQRRKCAPDCALAPYFPHDRQRQFLNAHKLFGVSNITKIIRDLSPPDKDIAMRTIIYQSDARAKDPVGGCYRIVRDLHHQIEYCKAELDLVLQQLALCKAQAYQQQLLQIGNEEVMPAASSGDPMMTLSSCNSDTNNNNNNDNSEHGEIIVNNNDYQELMRCYYEEDQENGQEYVPPHAHTWSVQEEAMLPSSNGSSDNNNHAECFMIRQDSGVVGGDEHGGFEVKPQMRIDDAKGANNHYDEATDYACKFEHTHLVDVSCGLQREELNFDSQQTIGLSEEVVLKENKVSLEVQEEQESFHHHHIPEHDLHGAATLFTLTN